MGGCYLKPVQQNPIKTNTAYDKVVLELKSKNKSLSLLSHKPYQEAKSSPVSNNSCKYNKK